MVRRGSTGSRRSPAQLPEGLGIARLVALLIAFAVSFWALTGSAQNLEADGAEVTGAEDVLVVSSGESSGMLGMDDLAPQAEIVGAGEPLGLDQAIAAAIQNNLRIEVERYEPMIAEADRAGAWGEYDPTLTSDFQYDVDAVPNASPFTDAEINKTRTMGGGIGVEQLLPYIGATVGLRYDASSVNVRSNFQLRDEQFNSGLFLTTRIPLARGLMWNEAWTNVKVSELAHQASREGFRQALMDTVKTTVDAYWDLVAARDQVRVAQKSLETARALLSQTETQFEVGVVSRVEVVEAEAGVADREFGVIRDANVYRDAQDQLIDRVLGRELSAMTDLQIAPSEDPGAYTYQMVDVDESVRQAFSKRPELAQALREIEQGTVNLKFSKNQRLPQLDIDGRFGYAGLSGEVNEALGDFAQPEPGDPPLRNIPFDESHNDYFTRKGADNYRVGATFSIPIPNTAGRKRVVRSELELRRARTRLARIEQTIILEVRSAARTLRASQQGIEAAERRRLAAEEQLRAERIRLEHGESTPFEVLQRESDLVEAESQKINALQTYRASEVALERAQGTILETRKIVLDEAAQPTH